MGGEEGDTPLLALHHVDDDAEASIRKPRYWNELIRHCFTERTLTNLNLAMISKRLGARAGESQPGASA